MLSRDQREQSELPGAVGCQVTMGTTPRVRSPFIKAVGKAASEPPQLLQTPQTAGVLPTADVKSSTAARLWSSAIETPSATFRDAAWTSDGDAVTATVEISAMAITSAMDRADGFI